MRSRRPSFIRMRLTWRFHRLLRDDQVAGDLRVGQAAGDQGQHFRFPVGELPQLLAVGSAGCAHPGEFGDEALGHSGGQQRVAGRDDPDRVGEFAGRGVLEQEAARSPPQRLVDVVVQVEGGQHQDLRGGPEGGDLPGGLQAVHHRHADIHQDHVRTQLRGARDRFLPVHGLADDLDVGLAVQQGGEAGPDHALVIGDHDSHGHGRPSRGSLVSGRTAVTRNPPSSVGAASRWPPSIVVRSRIPMMP